MNWTLCVLLILMGTTEGFRSYNVERCEFNSSDPKDIRLIYSSWYNKAKLFSFDSGVGRFVGYTEYGVKQAKYFNNQTAILEKWRHEKERYCVHNIQIWNDNILTKSVEPYAVLSMSPSSGSEKVLVCSVYGFYPENINVTWSNHHQPITDKVTFTELMPDSDWYYQLHSTLEYSPRSGDQISCVIEHISLNKPMVLDYDGAVSDADKNKYAIGASGLVLGLVLSLAGFLYYRHKSRGLTLVPTH